MEKTQEATSEATREMAEEGYSEDGENQMGMRASAAGLTEKQEETIDHLKDNELIYNKCLVDFKNLNKWEALWDGFCAENKMKRIYASTGVRVKGQYRES